MNIDKQILLIKELVEHAGVSNFTFSVDRYTEKEYGITKIIATWSAPLMN